MKIKFLLRIKWMKDSILFAGEKEEVSPGKYLKIERVERGTFKETSIRPPRLGGKDFGMIIVKREGPFPAKRDRRDERR